MRAKRAEIEEALDLTRKVRQEEELQDKEARAPFPCPHHASRLRFASIRQLLRIDIRARRGSRRSLLAGQGGGVHRATVVAED